MLLYHGSNVSVEYPKILISDRKLDFGTGFYLTSSYEQAERWAILSVKRRGTGTPTITSYKINEKAFNELNVLRFKSADVEWLKFVSENRSGKDNGSQYDVIIGAVANDRTMPVIRLFFAGVYTEEETVKRLLPQNLKDQYAFKTKRALKTLTVDEVIIK